MNARLEALARERELLVACSALGRLRLRRRSQALRQSLSWRGLAVAAARTPAAGPLAFELTLTLVGARLAARAIVLANLALSLAGAVRALTGYARSRALDRRRAIPAVARGAFTPTAAPPSTGPVLRS